MHTPFAIESYTYIQGRSNNKCTAQPVTKAGAGFQSPRNMYTASPAGGDR